MIFRGLSLSGFGILAASLAVGLLLIYILRYKRRGRTIGSNIIWKRVMGARRSIWTEILAFLLHLLILLIVAFALTDPTPKRSAIQRRYVAIILDSSLSMGATDRLETGDEDGLSRMDRAAEKAWGILDNLQEVDRAMVVTVGSEVRALTGFTNNGDSLRTALESIQPEGRAPKVDQAVEYVQNAFSFLKPKDGDSLHLYAFTDQPDRWILPNLDGIETKVYGVGSPMPNTGIVAFDVRKPYNLSGGHELLVKVANFSDKPSKTNLIVYTPKATVGKETMTLAPEEIRTEHYHLPFGVQGRVTALLQNITYEGDQDRLSVDNASFAFIPDQKKIRVLLVTAGNLFLQKALAINPQVALSAIAPTQYSPGQAFGADVVIFDDFTPPKSPPANALYIHPMGPPFEVRKAVEKPTLTGWKDGHPILRYIKLNELNIEQANPIAIRKGDTVLAEHYDDAMMVLRESGGKKLMGIGFALKKSDLALRVAFPILFHNAVVWFAESENVERRTTHRIGDAPAFPVFNNPDRITLTRPDQSTLELYPRAGVVAINTTMPGFYSFDNGKAPVTLAVSLTDEAESDLTDARSDPVQPPVSQQGSARREKFWPFLILLAFALVVFDFWLYNNGKLP